MARMWCTAMVGIVSCCLFFVMAAEETPIISMTLDRATAPATPSPGARRKLQTEGRKEIQDERRMKEQASTALSTATFRIGIAGAVGVATSRVKLTAWDNTDFNEIPLKFYFSASSATGDLTSTELATKLQYLLFLKNSAIYAETLYPMHITSASFAGLPAATPPPPTPVPPTTSAAPTSSATAATSAASTAVPPTPNPQTSAASSSFADTTTAVAVGSESSTEAPPTPKPTEAPPTPEPTKAPPTPVPAPTTPVPTPLAPREVINGSGVRFGNGITEAEEETSTIWIVVMICIGVLALAGTAVCLIKICGSKKKEEKRVYGDRI